MKAILLCLALSAVALLAAATTLPASQDPGPTLANDPRLAKRLTVGIHDRPCAAVLEGIQKDLGVRMTAARDVADDKATLFLKDRPASEVMALLARHFDFRWRRSGQGYELFQEEAAKKREAALREETTVRQLAELYARMDRVAEFAALSAAERDQRSRRLGERLRQPNLSAAEREDARREVQALADVQSLRARAAGAFWRSLGPADRERLVRDGIIRRSSVDGTLPQPLTEAIFAVNAELLARLPNEERLPDDPPTEAYVTARLTPQVLPGFGRRLSGIGQVSLVFGLESRTAGPRGGRTTSFWFPGMGSSRTPVVEKKAMERDPALAKTVTLSFPETGRDIGPRPHPERVGKLPPPSWVRLDELAAAIHEAAGFEVVADGFVRARLSTTRVVLPGNRPRPLGDLLDLVDSEMDYAWTRQGNLLLLRSRTWFFDRPAEVPERALRDHARRVASHGNPTLEDFGALAAALADLQCLSMEDHSSWYLEDYPINRYCPVYRLRHDLRFWASLTDAQRKTAATPAGLPAGELSAPQRRVYLAALMAEQIDEHDGMRSPLPAPGPPPAEELASATVRLTFRELNSGEPAVPNARPPRRRVQAAFLYMLPGRKDPVRQQQVVLQ